MRIHVLLAALALAACSPAAEKAETAPPAEAATSAPETVAPGAAITFTTPSGNIGCIYIPNGGADVYQPAQPGAELSCDRAEPEYTRVVLPEHAAASVVATDERGCCSGETIPYGDSWNEGPFTCQITEANVACTSTEGHGFTLSRSTADVR